MSEHTPGSWFFEGAVGVVATPADEDDADIDDQGHRYVFVFDPRTIGETTCLANLELAAAAPDLLKALKVAEWGCHGHCPICGGGGITHHPDCILAAAIKKAEGEKETDQN